MAENFTISYVDINHLKNKGKYFAQRFNFEKSRFLCCQTVCSRARVQQDALFLFLTFRPLGLLSDERPLGCLYERHEKVTSSSSAALTLAVPTAAVGRAHNSFV